jgi:hypothetical protein
LCELLCNKYGPYSEILSSPLIKEAALIPNTQRVLDKQKFGRVFQQDLGRKSVCDGERQQQLTGMLCYLFPGILVYIVYIMGSAYNRQFRNVALQKKKTIVPHWVYITT